MDIEVWPAHPCRDQHRLMLKQVQSQIQPVESLDDLNKFVIGHLRCRYATDTLCILTFPCWLPTGLGGTILARADSNVLCVFLLSSACVSFPFCSRSSPWRDRCWSDVPYENQKPLNMTTTLLTTHCCSLKFQGGFENDKLLLMPRLTTDKLIIELLRWILTFCMMNMINYARRKDNPRGAATGQGAPTKKIIGFIRMASHARRLQHVLKFVF